MTFLYAASWDAAYGHFSIGFKGYYILTFKSSCLRKQPFIRPPNTNRYVIRGRLRYLIPRTKGSLAGHFDTELVTPLTIDWVGLGSRGWAWEVTSST